jgi:cytochrome P450
MKAIPQTNLPPSVKPFWIGGHFRMFRKDPPGFLSELAKLGDISSFKMGSIQAYFLNDPEMIRDLLIVNAHKFVKGRALQRAKSLLGEGLLTSEGEFHLRQRRMIQPAFHRQRIAEYARAMIEFGEKISDEWRDGDERDMTREMMRLTLNIVGKTLFSANVEDDSTEVGKAMTTLVEMFNILLLPFAEILEKLPLPHSIRFRRAKKTLDEVIYKIIEERRRSGEDLGDLLSMLLLAQDEEGDGQRMSDQQIRDECLTLFLAGHETTANALTWTWYLLAQNPEKEAKFHAELDDVFADGHTPNFEDYVRLPFTESVLAESMRLFPPAWAIGRLSTEEHEFGGYKLAKKSLVLISPFVTHRDARFWENAGEFRPERWLEQSVKEAGQKYIYFPFGGGTRRCIGESFAWTEGVLLLATLGRRWKFKLDPKQRIGLQAMITLRPKYGMKMKIETRL